MDAHAINSQGDLSRELGWYVGQARESAGTVGNGELVQDSGLFREMSSGAIYLDFCWGNHSTCIEMRCHE